MAFTNVERLSERVTKVVQDDRFGQYAFLYVVRGEDKIVVIDTGCSQPAGKTFREFLVSAKLNPAGLPWLVVNTHVHFDHVGGNASFQADGSKCLGVAMGAGNKKFTENFELTSNAAAVGATVDKFSVTRWLEDNERIYLDDKNKTDELSLQVLYTPGHTSDSISLWFAAEHRMFVGDLLYPFTAIHLDCLGSNVQDWIASIDRLRAFIKSATSAKVSDSRARRSSASKKSPRATSSSPPAGATATSATANAEAMFLATVGLDASTANASFSVADLLALCDGSAEAAVSMYLDNPGGISQLVPPKPASASAPGPGSVPSSTSTRKVLLSCGHVEANLDASALQTVRNVVVRASNGHLPPHNISDEYAEYSDDNFTVVMKMAK